MQGEAGRVPRETGARHARSPAPQASRTAPLGASMRPRAARATPPCSSSPAGPLPWVAGTCAGDAQRSQSLRGVLRNEHLSGLGASPFRPPPELRRTSPAQAWPCPLWTPDSGFSASFRKGRFFSRPPRRKVWEHHPDCFLSQHWRAAGGRIRHPGILLDDSREHSCLCPLSCQHAQVTAVGIGAGGVP